eukprot:3409379-Pleurochrysis_carterae.AAC.1
MARGQSLRATCEQGAGLYSEARQQPVRDCALVSQGAHQRETPAKGECGRHQCTATAVALRVAARQR